MQQVRQKKTRHVGYRILYIVNWKGNVPFNSYRRNGYPRSLQPNIEPDPGQFPLINIIQQIMLTQIKTLIKEVPKQSAYFGILVLQVLNKNKYEKINITISFVIVFYTCESPDNTVNFVLENFEKGAVIRTIGTNGTIIFMMK